MDRADTLLYKSNIREGPFLAGSDIPNFLLYGEAYRGPFPDCLHCETLSERSRLHDWWIKPHRHYGLHQFFWIETGGAVISTEGNKISLTAQTAIMNAPAAVHGFAWQAESEGYVVTIPTVNLERSLPGPTTLLSHLTRSLIVPCSQDVERSAKALSLFKAIAREYGEHERGRTEALLCHAGLLALWFLRSPQNESDGDQKTRPYVALVRRFLSLLEDHYKRHRPLSFYADALDITPTHLSRACKRQLGISAQATVHDRLLLEAKRMLAYTPASIARIAEDLGFGDPAYFTRFFSQHAGEAPGSYRRAFSNMQSTIGNGR